MGDDNDGPDADDDDDSADEYDEDLYKSAADKAELLAKTDLEREMILAERHDRKQKRVEHRAAKRIKHVIEDTMNVNAMELVVAKRASQLRSNFAC